MGIYSSERVGSLLDDNCGLSGMLGVLCGGGGEGVGCGGVLCAPGSTLR